MKNEMRYVKQRLWR